MQEPAPLSYLEQRVAKSWPPRHWVNFPAVVAVSGGPDSTALACALHRLAREHSTEPRLVLAHVHHGWRGAEADQDQQAVESLAHDLGLPCYVRRCSPPTSGHGLGWEALARQERYRLLRDVAREVSARYVATAHTLDDQVETVLGRILRGTGVEGLRGIAPMRPLDEHVTVVRPLLRVSRRRVLAYLRQLARPWREDSTNLQTRFLRGYLRVELLPVIRRRFGRQAEKAFIRLSDDARLLYRALEPMVEQHRIDSLLQECPESVLLRRSVLASLAPALRLMVLRRQWRRQAWPERDMTRRHWLMLGRVCTSCDVAGITLPGGVQLRVDRDTVRLERHSP